MSHVFILTHQNNSIQMYFGINYTKSPLVGLGKLNLLAQTI